MPTELEQEFYDTFGIEPEHNDGCKLVDNYWNNENLQKQYKTFDEYLNTNCTESDSGLCYSTCDFAYDDLKYPDITPEKLLEMICILNSIYDCGFKNNTSLASKEVKYLKMEILKHCILHKEQIKTQIQQLFKD